MSFQIPHQIQLPAGLLAFPADEFSEIIAHDFVLEFHGEGHGHDIADHGAVARQREREIRAVENFVGHEEFKEPHMIHIPVVLELHERRVGDRDVGVEIVMLHHVPQAHHGVVEHAAVQLQDLQFREIHGNIIHIHRMLILGARARAALQRPCESARAAPALRTWHTRDTDRGCSGSRSWADESLCPGSRFPWRK